MTTDTKESLPHEQREALMHVMGPEVGAMVERTIAAREDHPSDVLGLILDVDDAAWADFRDQLLGVTSTVMAEERVDRERRILCAVVTWEVIAQVGSYLQYDWWRFHSTPDGRRYAMAPEGCTYIAVLAAGGAVLYEFRPQLAPEVLARVTQIPPRVIFNKVVAAVPAPDALAVFVDRHAEELATIGQVLDGISPHLVAEAGSDMVDRMLNVFGGPIEGELVEVEDEEEEHDDIVFGVTEAILIKPPDLWEPSGPHIQIFRQVKEHLVDLCRARLALGMEHQMLLNIVVGEHDMAWVHALGLAYTIRARMTPVPDDVRMSYVCISTDKEADELLVAYMQREWMDELLDAPIPYVPTFVLFNNKAKVFHVTVDTPIPALEV